MTVIRTQFDYPAKVRKRGHRKVSDVIVRERAAFEIPDVVPADAPVALRTRDGRRRGPDVRSVGGQLFAPLVDEAGAAVAAGAANGIAGLRAVLCERTAGRTFLLPGPLEIMQAPVENLGHHHVADEREARLAEVSRAAAAGFAAIDGTLHMRIPEPMLVVVVEFSRTIPASLVSVDFDQSPGHRCQPTAEPSVAALAHFRLDQREEAERMADLLCERFGFRRFEGAATSAESRRRPEEPDVADASLLSADPLAVTLTQSIRSLLAVGHEALARAPDAFVLAWADMRESLALLEAGHAEAVRLAADSMKAFLAAAPAAEQFATAAARGRWESRGLPLLTARVAAVEALCRAQCVRDGYEKPPHSLIP